MQGYKNKYRIVMPNGKVKTFPTEDEARAEASQEADRLNANILVDEWSADHPQDEINEGWANIGVAYRPGGEPTVPEGERIAAKDIQRLDNVAVWGFPAGEFGTGKSRFHYGCVGDIEEVALPGLTEPGLRIRFASGWVVEATSIAVTYRKEPLVGSLAERTKAVYDFMHKQNVSLYDLELWGHVKDREDEVLGSPEQAFDALIADGFSLGDSRSIEHYWQATADYVGDALAVRDLLKDEEN